MVFGWGLLPMHVFGDEFKLVPQISIRNHYNDNIFYDEQDDDKIDDFYTIISPEIRLTERTETLDAMLRSRIDRNEYQDEEDLNATDQLYDGRIRYRLSERIRCSVEAGYSRDSRVDRDIEVTGLVLGTPIRERTHYAGSAEFALTEKTSTGLSYSYDEDVFDDPEYADSTSQDLSLTFIHNLDALVRETTVRFTAGYALYEYPYEDITSYSLLAGMSKRFTETFEISVDAGGHLTRADYDFMGIFEDDDTTRGGIGQAAATYRGELTTTSLTFSHVISSISGEPGTVRRTSARYSLRRRFTYEVTGDLTIEYYMNRQDRRYAFSSRIDEDTFRVQPRVIYAFSPDLRIEASYRYTRRLDNEDDERMMQNLCYLGFSWQYPIPR